MSKKTLHYVIHGCGPQECDCSAVCNPREGDEIQITTDASQVTCGNCLRVMAKRKVPLASDQVARLQGPKSICDALQQQIKALRQHKTDYMESADATRRALEADIARLKGMLEAAQNHAVSAQHHALDMGQRALRAVLHSCAKASSAAEVGLIVDEALAASQAQRALAPENQRVVPVEPTLAPPHPFDKPSLLKGCNVTYSNSSKPLTEQRERQGDHMAQKLNLVECDNCPRSGGCVGTCMRANAGGKG